MNAPTHAPIIEITMGNGSDWAAVYRAAENIPGFEALQHRTARRAQRGA